MVDGVKLDDNQLKLYALLVDQLQKYNTILWQVPTALVVANFIGLNNFLSNPFMVTVLFVFDTTLIYAFHRMVIQQRAIIAATKNAENELKKMYDSFIPNFSSSKLRAPGLFVWVLWGLDLSLMSYSIYLIYNYLNT